MKYRTLTEKYDLLYQAHLEAFGQRVAQTFTDAPLCTDFYPCIGVPQGQPVELLVYGQAVGGWQEPLDYSMALPRDRAETSRCFSNQAYEGDNPMDWVNVQWSRGTALKRPPQQREHYAKWFGNYWTNRSFFWQVITGLSAELRRLPDTDWSWNQHVIWSNLYKISPQGANPDEGLRALQRPEAVQLVRSELEELNPRLCLVLTNETWWSPFRRGIGTEILSTSPAASIDSVERYADTPIVIAKRPRVGSWRTTVRDVLAVLQQTSNLVAST